MATRPCRHADGRAVRLQQRNRCSALERHLDSASQDADNARAARKNRQLTLI